MGDDAVEKKSKKNEPDSSESNTGRDMKLSTLLKNRTPYDDIDLKMLLILKKDARISNINLAKELNVNEVTITRRLQNLWDRGIIKCSYTIIDYQKLGLALNAVMTLRVHPSNIERTAKKLGSEPYVFGLHRVLDIYQSQNLVCDLHFHNMAELQEFFDRISQDKEIEEFEYYILSKPFKEQRHLRL